VAALGGNVIFSDTASASSALLRAFGSSIGPGGSLQFLADASGGTAQVEFEYGDNYSVNASLNISDHNPPGITIGSLSDGSPGGTGNVILGSNNLTVGRNNLSTDFSGVIEGSGSLIKIGDGTLTLTGASLHQGGTTVNRGKLLVNNTTGSGTGTGPVNVDGGILSGTGTIAGAVTVGAGPAREANLASGPSGTLTIQSTLFFDLSATLRIRINSNTAKAGAVAANGITINAAQFSMADSGNTTLPTGTTFTIITNTSTTPIAGAFANLADGSTLTIGGNTFQADYEGGDGNDLTLTVVP
jgi:autotransporter-associated beta strand protein